MKKQYRQILELSRDILVPLPSIRSPDKLPLPKHVMELLGKTFKFKGSGRDINLDRIYIREKIFEFNSRYTYLIEQLHVQMPSAILEGNKELILLDSSEDYSKSLNILDNTNLLLIAIERRGISDSLSNLLKKSKFLDKYLTKSEEHKIAVLDLTEREEVESLLSAHHMYYFKSIDQLTNLKLQLVSHLKHLFLERENYNLSMLPLTDKLLERIRVLPIKPLLYNSLFQAKNNKDLAIQENLFLDISNKTNIPILLNFISDMSMSKLAGTLKSFNKDWKIPSKSKTSSSSSSSSHTSSNNSSSNSSGLNIIDKLSNFVFSKKNNPVTVEFLISNLQDSTKVWKAEFSDLSSSIYSLLQQKAKESNQHIVINNGAIQAFIETIFLYWEKRISETLNKSTSLTSTINQLLDESIKAVKFNGPNNNNNNNDQRRIPQIVRFCKGSAERSVDFRIHEIKEYLKSLNIIQSIQNICKSSPDTITFQNRKFPQISEVTIRSIYRLFSDCLTFALKQVEKIEKLYEDCIRCIAYSPTLSGAQIMHFLMSTYMQGKPFNMDNHSLLEFQKQHGLLELHRTLEVSQFDLDWSCSPVDFTDNIWNLLHRTRDYSIERFDLQLEDANLLKIDIESDSNSQFRTFAYLIFGVEGVHTAMRLLLMNEILSNLAYYTKLIQGKSIDIHDYIYSMSKENEYGDYLSLFAFSNFYYAELILFTPLYAHPIKISPDQRNNNNQQCERYYIAYVNKNQYIPLSHNNNRKKKSSLGNVEEELGKLNIRDSKQSKNIPVIINNNNNNDNLSTGSIISASPSRKVFKSDEYTVIPRLISTTTNTLSSLSDICINVICKHIYYLPPLEGILPEDLVQKIITLLVQESKLSCNILSKLLDSSISNLNLSKFKSWNTDASILVSTTCKYLRKLNLSYCSSLSSTDLIAIVSNCSTTLELLDLEGCYKLDDSALKFISIHCSNLSYLNLSNCSNISNTGVMYILSSISSLTDLYLCNCDQLTDDSLNSNIVCSLQTLDLSGCNQFTDNSLNSILKNSCSQSLSTFKFIGKNISESVLISLIQTSSSISTLEISQCSNLSDLVVSKLPSYLVNLKTLSLPYCKNISDSSICNLPLYNTQYLNLEKCNLLSSKSLFYIASHYIQLQSINLSQCENIVTEDALVLLGSKCRDLRNINLSGCIKVTDKAICNLAQNCLYLKELNLSNCTKITDKSLYEISLHSSNLSDINISSCEGITDEGLSKLADGCIQLKTIYLEECKITDESIKYLVRKCRNIEVLNLAYCKDITDSAIESLATFCPNIKILDLSYSKFISPVLLNHLIRYWPKLHTLHIRGYSQISVEGFNHPNLQHLDLSWCKNLVDTSIAKIATGCPMLESVHVTWCAKLTSNAIHTLVRKLPNLRTLNVRGCNKVSMLMMKHLINNGIKILN